MTLFTSLMDQLSPGEVFGHSEVLFHAIELGAREVTNSSPHIRKPSSKEKELTRLLGSDRSSPGFAQKCEQLVSEIHEARLNRANKRVHASLVSGKGMKRAPAAHTQVLNPPIPLLTHSSGLSRSPRGLCSTMSGALSQLGG